MSASKASKFEGVKKTAMSVMLDIDDGDNFNGTGLSGFAHCCGVSVVGGFGAELVHADLDETSEEADGGDGVTLAHVMNDVDASTKFLCATTRENQKLAAEELAHHGFKAVGTAKRSNGYVLTFWLKTIAA